MALKSQIRELEARFSHKAGGSDTIFANRLTFDEGTDEKVGAWKASFWNPSSRVVNKIKSGDEVTFWLRKDAEGALSRIGGGVVGPMRRTFERGKISRIDVEGLEFSHLLTFLHSTKSVVGEVDVGTLIHDVWEETGAASTLGITLGGVPDPFGATVKNVRFDYVDLLEFLTRLAELVGAGFHVDSGKVLNFYLRGVADSGITEDGSGGVGFEFTEDPETIENVVRGYGGRVFEAQKKQETRGTTSTVTTSVERSVRFQWPLDEIPKIEVWVEQVSGSTSDLDVRLEAEGTAPNPNGVPLARTTIKAADIPASGEYKEALLPSHTIGPGSWVHLIVKATTVLGVKVGVDNGTDLNLTYRAYSAIELISEKSDLASIASYGRREGPPIRDSSIQTLDELLLRIDARIRNYKLPTHTGTFEVVKTAYLTATLGRFVTVNLPELDAALNGKQMALTGRKHEIRDHHYYLFVSLAEGPRERQAGDVSANIIRRLQQVETDRASASSTLVQLLTATDTQAHADAATITAAAKGSFRWGSGANRNKWGLGDWA